MRNTMIVTAVVMLWMVSSALSTQEAGMPAQDPPPISFKKEVFPIIEKKCLPCHAEDNYNPSGLVLDTHETLTAGGEHGKALEPGKGKESMLVQKLAPKPPFGEMMPLDKKRKKGEESKKKLSEVEVQTIVRWIDQGAKDN